MDHHPFAAQPGNVLDQFAVVHLGVEFVVELPHHATFDRHQRMTGNVVDDVVIGTGLFGQQTEAAKCGLDVGIGLFRPEWRAGFVSFLKGLG